jgi:small subunit ribosomal protein S8
MAVTDPIADYLTRLRNAIKAKHKRVDVPASILKLEVTKILLDNNFIQHFVTLEEGTKKSIRIYLKYSSDGSVIKGLKRISKPGIRRYTDSEKLPRIYNGLGIAVISTSKGVMTEKKARQLKVGGEVMCYVW